MSRPALEAEVRFGTLAGMLRARAAERPDQPAFTFLADGEAEAGRLTYAQLDRRAAAVAPVIMIGRSVVKAPPQCERGRGLA